MGLESGPRPPGTPVTKCPACKGAGHVGGKACHVCNGSGKIKTS